MTYGETIRQGREAAGLTQEELAEALSVSRQAVSKWEADKSRPARDKLETLTEVLALPPDTWAAIDAAEQAAQQTEREGAAGRSARRWRRAASALAVLLALSVTVQAATLWHFIREDAPAAETEPPVDTSYMFPETLPLHAQQVPDFGEMPLEPGDPAAITEEKQQAGQAEAIFIDQFPTSSWLEIVRANPVYENHTTFYDVYACFFKSILDPDSPTVPLGRIDSYNLFVGDGLDGAEYFTGVLGHDGWKITLCQGAACVTSWYFYVTMDDGEVHLLLEASGSVTPQEYDVDADGQKEVVTTSFGLPMVWFIYDTLEDGRCVSYELDQEETPIGFSAEEGFTVTDSVGTVMARYQLSENQLKRQPQTDFSLEDYAAVAGTDLTFTVPEDPDQVRYNGTVRVTPRQQAYLALQELYHFTGLTVERAWCAVDEAGTVAFSADPAGEQVFYQVAWGANVGGSAEAPGLSLVWREDADWSPLEAACAKGPETGASWTEPKQLLAWQYRQLRYLAAGETATVALAPGEDAEASGPHLYRLYLTDGSYYAAVLSSSPRLYSLFGPYPAPK